MVRQEKLAGGEWTMAAEELNRGLRYRDLLAFWNLFTEDGTMGFVFMIGESF